MIILAEYKDEMHTIKFDNTINLKHLTSQLLSLFKSLPQLYCLKLKTEDGEIQIKGDLELDQIRNMNKNVIKINIYERQSLDETHLSSNTNLLDDPSLESNEKLLFDKRRPLGENQCVQCYGQIYNVLFRCSVCPRLNLCQNCEYQFDHVHPLIKIKEKEYWNLKVFVALERQLDKSKSQDIGESDVKQVEIESRSSNTTKKFAENVLSKVEAIKNFSFGEYFGKAKNSEEIEIVKQSKLKSDPKVIGQDSVKEYHKKR